MSVVDEYFGLAKRVLEADGRIEQINPLRFAVVYDDRKIRVSGVLTRDTTEYENVTVFIYMAPESDARVESEGVFALPQNPDKQLTIVYYWRNHPQFSRSGRWVNYLHKLNADIARRYAASRALNRQPIDDRALFPEFD